MVFFATGNVHKFNEVRSILKPLGLSVAMIRMKGDEIQSESLQEIASKSVINAFRCTGLPIFVEDAGLFINALSGFPGPYAAYVYKTIHNSGILKLMAGIEDRQATFQSVIAYLNQTFEEPMCFFGECKGTITTAERTEQGKSGFGFDPIFQPDGNGKTFAEMTIAEKNDYSHRAIAIRKFAEWFKQKT
jgi:XTP/dITP diphosphohydrolase